MRVRLAALSGALLAMFALTACGSDKAPSKSSYIAKADKVCKADGAAVNKAAAKLTAHSTTQEFASFKKVAVPALQSENKKLRDLKKPKGDEKTLNAIYDEVDAASAKIKATAPEKIAALFQGNLFVKANKDATAYGMKVCGK